MNRFDYIKAAIVNDQIMYDDLQTDYYFWNSYSLFQKWQACFDFITLHREKIRKFHEWMFPSEEEISEAYFYLMNNWDE